MKNDFIFDFTKGVGLIIIERCGIHPTHGTGFSSIVPVAQLDRALASGAKGRGFESPQVRGKHGAAAFPPYDSNTMLIKECESYEDAI